MNLERVPNWQLNFWNWMTEAASLPFAWGTHDCVLGGARTVDAVCGTDFYDQVRTRYPYTNEEEARTVISAGGGLEALISEYLGQSTVWARCSIGDVVLVRWRDREVLCSHDGVQLVGPNDVGHFVAPFALAACGWKVG